MLTHLLNPPLTALEFVERSMRCAVANARTATESLQAQNDGRRRLAPVSADQARGDAGELVSLSREECLRLLRTRHVGRLAYVARAETPDVVPVNYTVDGPDRILVRSGPGPKLQAASRRAAVAFEVDAIDETGRTGWSVVVHARASVAPPGQRARMSERVVPWAGGPRDEVICLLVRRVEGRRLS